MSTTSGSMKSLKVTDASGNVYVMTPVDTEARRAIDEAKNLQFDSDYFTADVSQDQSTVNVGLNGVPIGLETPLQFSQDDEHGIVLGLDTSALDIPTMTGATEQAAGTAGLVPAPGIADRTKFLKGDGTWTEVPQQGTVNDAKLKLKLGSAEAVETGFTANTDTDATIEIPVMTGATAQEAGDEGLVPAPTTSDTDKFLKGDGTWGYPASADLTYYYYDSAHNGLSAITSKSQVASLVGTSGNLNGASIAAVFKLNWGGVVREILGVNTVNENLSYLHFGSNSSAPAGNRYLLPRPTANKFAQTNSSGEIIWGDVPSPLPTPTHDNELFVGMSDGTSSWKQLTTIGTSTQLLDENDDPILDETGEPIYDDEPILWKTLDDRGFYAERALADSDGREIKTTYSTVDSTASAISALAQQVDAGYQRKLLYGSDYSRQQEYILIDGNWVPTYVNVVPNNVVTHIPFAIRNGEVLRFMCKVNRSAQESPNFAIEIELIALSASDTATVEVYIEPNGPQSAYLAKHSLACSTTVSPDKYYQLTCVGTCWTIAEFGTANA